MKEFLRKIRPYTNTLFGTRAAGIYILLFAAAIGIATFIENDFGTSSAQHVIFKAWWFELLLFLFAVTILVNIFRFSFIPRKKWAILTFHLAMIIILTGAAITRYFGYEGIMHIREGEASSSFLTAETYLQFEVLKDGNSYKFDEEVLFSTLGNNDFDESYKLGSDIIDIKVTDFIPNPTQLLETQEEGGPIIKVVFGGMSGREEYFLRMGDSRRVRDQIFNFRNDEIPGAVNIYFRNDSLLISHDQPMSQMVMATQERDTLFPSGRPHVLRLRSLYTAGNSSFVFGDFNKSGRVVIESEDPKVKNESMTALKMDITVNGNTQSKYVYGKKHLEGRPAIYDFGTTRMAVSYGAKPRSLPFRIKLYDFIMERYPGTNSAASYASEVQLIDPRNNVEMDYRIFMNNILTYNGFRFFQSSFDQDELGTYLSVNNDFWGTWVSYLGYFLLTAGMLLLFVSRNTHFHNVIQKIKKIRALPQKSMVLFLLCTATVNADAQQLVEPEIHSVPEVYAESFSKVVVQDHKGRMKPMHTLTREILRKVSRRDSYSGLNADQVILNMFGNKQEWMALPIIKLGKSEQLNVDLNLEGEYASYKDFFNTDGSYKLKEQVRRAYGLRPIDRGNYEKEIMKVDERVNIISMVFSGSIFKVIPVPGHENNLWVSAQMAGHGNDAVSQPVAERFFPAFREAIHQGLHQGDYALYTQLLSELEQYQCEHGMAVMPSGTKIKSEITLNKLNVFGRLSVFYTMLGLVFLGTLFYTVFSNRGLNSKLFLVLSALVFMGFAFHTLGLGLRWYVSGRAPWSNGYESMIYIAWTTTLAGIIFTRKSIGGLAATMILAGTILMVAQLSYLDPEITPLVPVLRSYWLTIHVSLIAGSYGFLMLGAIIGLINLILFMFLTEINKNRIHRIATEMSYISEITLTGGLVMISIGTYLGGVWANESWGRYWGWDAKETWALVTILVYAFILHMRIMPKVYSLYNYNLATLFGWASVIMTYFGVNYYLSGLHSYAAGDPIPIPLWVYISVVSVAIISVIAYFRKRAVGLDRV